MDFTTDNNKASEMDNVTQALISNANTDTTTNNKLEMDESSNFFGMTGDHNNHHHHINDKLNNIIDLGNTKNPFGDFVEGGGEQDEHNFGIIDNKEHALMPAGMEKACLETDGDMGPETSVDITDDADTDPLECSSTLSHSKETLPSTDNPFDINNKAGSHAFDSDNIKDIHDKSTAPISPCTDMPFDSDIQSAEMHTKPEGHFDFDSMANQGDNFYEKRDDLHLGEDNFKTDDETREIREQKNDVQQTVTDIDQLDDIKYDIEQEIMENIEVAFCGSVEAVPGDVSHKADMAYNEFADYIEQPLMKTANNESRESLDLAAESHQEYPDLLDDRHHGEEHINGTQSLTPALDTPSSVSPAPISPVPHTDYDSMIDHGEPSDHEQLDDKFVHNFDEVKEKHVAADDDAFSAEEEKHIVDDILMEQEKHENELQENEKHTDDFMQDVLAAAKPDQAVNKNEDFARYDDYEKDVDTLEQPFISDTVETIKETIAEHDAEMFEPINERLEFGPPHEVEFSETHEPEIRMEFTEQRTEQIEFATTPSDGLEVKESHTKESVVEHMLENLQKSQDDLDQMENVIRDHVELLTTNDDNDVVVESLLELQNQEQTMDDKLPSLEHNEQPQIEIDTVLNEEIGIETKEFEKEELATKEFAEPTLDQSIGDEPQLACTTDTEPKVEEKETVVETVIETVEKVESFTTSQEPEELIKKETLADIDSIIKQTEEQIEKNLSDSLDKEVEDMSSQLNPDAKEFVPGTSPTSFDSRSSGILSAVPKCLNGDDVIAQSPQKGGGYSMENIVIPDEKDFDVEAAKCPADMDDENKPLTPLLPIQVTQCMNGDDLIAQSPQKDTVAMNDFKVPTPSEFEADVACRPSELSDSPQALNLKEAMHEPEKEQVSPMEQYDSSLNESSEICSPVDTSFGQIEDMMNTVQMLPHEDELEADGKLDHNEQIYHEMLDSDASLNADVSNLKLEDEPSRPAFEELKLVEEPKLFEEPASLQPVVEEPKPVEEALLFEKPTPAFEEFTPTVEEATPAIEESIPAPEISAPAFEEPSLINDTPQTIPELSAVVEEPAAPVIEEPKPVIEAIKPIIELSKPIIEEKITKTKVEKVTKAAEPIKKTDLKTKTSTTGVKKTASTTSSSLADKTKTTSTTTAAKTKVGSVSAPRPRTTPAAAASSKPVSIEKKTTTLASARAKPDTKASPTGLKKLPLTKPKTEDIKPAVRQVASKVASATRTATTTARTSTTTGATATAPAKRSLLSTTTATKTTTGTRPLLSPSSKPSTLTSAHKTTTSSPRSAISSTLRKTETLKSPTKPATTAKSSTTTSASTVSKITSRTSVGSATTTRATTTTTSSTTTKRMSATATSKPTVASSTTAKKPLFGIKKNLGATTTASKLSGAKKTASPLANTKVAVQRPPPVAAAAVEQPVVDIEQPIEIKMNGNASPLVELAPELATEALAVTTNGDIRED